MNISDSSNIKYLHKYLLSEKEMSFGMPIYERDGKLFSVSTNAEHVIEDFIEVEIDRKYLKEVSFPSNFVSVGQEALVCYMLKINEIYSGTKDFVEYKILEALRKYELLFSRKCFAYLNALDFLSPLNRNEVVYNSVLKKCHNKLVHNRYLYADAWLRKRAGGRNFDRLFHSSNFEELNSSRRIQHEELDIEYHSFTIYNLFKLKRYDEVITNYENQMYQNSLADKKYYSLSLVSLGFDEKGLFFISEYLKDKSVLNVSDLKLIVKYFSKNDSMIVYFNDEFIKQMSIYETRIKTEKNSLVLIKYLDSLLPLFTELESLEDYRLDSLISVINKTMKKIGLPYNLKEKLNNANVNEEIVVYILASYNISIKKMDRAFSYISKLIEMNQREYFSEREVGKIIKLVPRLKDKLYIIACIDSLLDKISNSKDSKNITYLSELYFKFKLKD